MNNKLNILSTLIVSLTVIFLNSCKSDDNATSSGNAFLGEIEAISTFGGTKNESAQSIVSTQDGGYVILGHTQSKDFDITDKTNESYDYWVLKFDENNQLQWNKTFGGSGDDRGKSIVQTLDGGYAILGQTNSANQDVTQNSGYYDFWLAKLDNAGNLIWEKSFGYSGLDIGISVIQTTDNGFLLTGVLDVTASGGEGNTKQSHARHAGGDYWAIKTNASGDIEWSKYYGGSYSEVPNDVIETNDGYIIVGSSDSDDVDISNNKGDYDFWVVKINTTGSIVWEKSFGGSEIDEAWSITNTQDGNYIIVGDARSNDQDISNPYGASDLWLIKINPLGAIIWEKSFGGSSFDSGRSISNTQDNGFIISGSTRSIDGDLSANNGQNDAWVLKIDANANIEWQKTIGGSTIDYLYDAIELPNKNIIAVGESSSNDFDLTNNNGFTDLLKIKIK
ncbi:hypothetical protein [Lacinutrix cladophorae]